MAHTIYGLYRDGKCVYVGRTSQRLATRTKARHYKFPFDEVRKLGTAGTRDHARLLEWATIQGMHPPENVVTGYREPRRWLGTEPMSAFEAGLGLWFLSIES